MMRTQYPITREHFIRVMGREPRMDDLPRANCPHAGTIGHLGCGWCKHDRPVWNCSACAGLIATRGGVSYG